MKVYYGYAFVLEEYYLLLFKHINAYLHFIKHGCGFVMATIFNDLYQHFHSVILTLCTIVNQSTTHIFLFFA